MCLLVKPCGCGPSSAGQNFSPALWWCSIQHAEFSSCQTVVPSSWSRSSNNFAWQICKGVSNWRGQCCVMYGYASPGLHTSGNPLSLLFSGKWHYLKQAPQKLFNPECRNESWHNHGWEAGQVTCMEPRSWPNIFTAVRTANTLSCISSPTK